MRQLPTWVHDPEAPSYRYRLAAMGEAGRAKVERLFSMVRIAEHTADLYEELAG